MGLTVLSGPPGSGREEVILERFEAALAADPLLVAPTRDDVDRLDRQLCRRPGGALAGGTLTTLPGLFEAVRRAVGAEARPTATRMQRIWLARAAARDAELRTLRRSARHEGFAPALESLISDLQAAGYDAAVLEGAIVAAEQNSDGLDGGGDGDASLTYEREIASLVSAYERLRDAAGLSDEGTLADLAISGLRANPAAWRSRPVFLLGFDDLSRQQTELVGALGAAAEVTIAITFEEDRPALAARAELRGTLVDELGADVEPPLVRAAGAGDALHHLERHLFEPDPPAAEPDPDSLRLLEGAGDRSEAELVGRAVAALLAAGTDPDDVAVALRSPDRQAPLFARVLAGLGVPVAPEARVALGETATGSALLRLLEIAAGSGTAADVVAFLRRPARAAAGRVDRLERAVLRERMSTGAEALAWWAGTGGSGGTDGGSGIWELDALAAAGTDPERVATVAARIAADVAERPHMRSGFVPSAGPGVELRAAAEIGRALEEVAALGPLAPTAGELAELLSHVRVPLWSGGTEGRVRILSPYRLRATRLRHLFVAGLADGAFPTRAPADPLLSSERRATLGLPARSDPAAEERFLFYSCVSLPSERLHLSYPASDESGTPKPRSPYVDEVRSLLLPPPSRDPADDPVEALLATRAEPEDVVPDPAHATSERDLARALAARGRTELTAGAAAQLPAELAERVGEALGRAGRAIEAAASPGPLTHPDVLAALAADRPYGASTLEEYDTCSYRWFVGHELRPRPLGPDAEPIENGGLAHAVLERLYREQPGGTARPGEDNFGRWIQRAAELAAEVAGSPEPDGYGWDLDSAQARIRLRRNDALIARFLRRDAVTSGEATPDPALLEVTFGDGQGDDHPAAQLRGFKLHGRIDRIDVAGNHALVRDYKLSSSVTEAAKLLKDGKLQMPLYLLAARSFGFDPAGGLYSPLGATEKDRPRGLMRKELKGSVLPSETADVVRTDFLEEEAFEELLVAAETRAGEIVAGMREGRIARDPRDGKCPTWCALGPICRIERGVEIEDPEAEEDAAA